MAFTVMWKSCLVLFTVVVIGLIPASFAACVVLIHIIWVIIRDLIQENVDLSFLLGKFRFAFCSAHSTIIFSFCLIVLLF